MKFEYCLSCLVGIEIMALANALSLDLIPFRLQAALFLVAALIVIAIIGFMIGRRSCRKLVHRQSFCEGVRKGIKIGRAERQSEVQRFLED